MAAAARLRPPQGRAVSAFCHQAHELHVPLWAEVFLPQKGQWAALDPLAPRALLPARAADARRARCAAMREAPLYVVGLGEVLLHGRPPPSCLQPPPRLTSSSTSSRAAPRPT